MKNSCNINEIKQFFFDLSHTKPYFETGGFFEIILDFTTSKYFEVGDHYDDAAQFAIDMAQAGHQVFFGPAPREKDLGKQRSTEENVLCLLSLWVDIDPPDKEKPPEQQLADSKNALDTFINKMDGYGFKPSYIVESGHGYHVYFLLREFYMGRYDKWQKVIDALNWCAKGDTQVGRPGALLRVPGTMNYKDKQNPKHVKIIEKNEVRYALEDFRQLYMDMVESDKAKKPKSFAVVGKGKRGFIPPCVASLFDPSNKPKLGYRHMVPARPMRK